MSLVQVSCATLWYYFLESLDNDKLIGLLEKLVENYKTTYGQFQQPKSLYLFLDEADQGKALDLFKAIFD